MCHKRSRADGGEDPRPDWGRTTTGKKRHPREANRPAVAARVSGCATWVTSPSVRQHQPHSGTQRAALPQWPCWLSLPSCDFLTAPPLRLWSEEGMRVPRLVGAVLGAGRAVAALGGVL